MALLSITLALLNVLSSIAITLPRKRELVALLLLSSSWLVTLSDLWLFIAVPSECLRCVIVVFLIILTCFLKH